MPLGGAGGAAGAGGGGAPGTGGTSGGPGGGGSGGVDAGGVGGGAPAECPDDGSDTAELTLAGLGFESPAAEDAGAGAGADAGELGDAGAADAGSVRQPALPGLIGWASVPGLGSPTTLGGAAGRVVTANTVEALQAYAASDEPLVIRVCGRLRVPTLEVSSFKTLVGVGERPTIEGGIALRGTPEASVRDVVIKNLRVNAARSNVAGVGILVERAHHVWIDHNELYDAASGLLHVVRGSDFVTVSWNKFLFTPGAPDREHRFACLISNHEDTVDTTAEDAEHLNVTLHHNWWADYIRQRAPRLRYGDVHLFNNFWTTAGNDYSIWADIGVRALLEGNYFRNVTNPHEVVHDDAQLLSRNNYYERITGLTDATGTAFVPPYDYSLDLVLNLPDLVSQGAGAR